MFYSPLLVGCLLCTSVVNNDNDKAAITCMRAQRGCEYLPVLQYTSQCSTSSSCYLPYVAGEHYCVKAESFQAKEGLAQSFLRAKLKKAAAGKENLARFDFVNETSAGKLGGSTHFIC